VWQDRRIGLASTRDATTGGHRSCAGNGAGTQCFHPVTDAQRFRDDTHEQRFFRAATCQQRLFRLGELRRRD